ncbi:hypothetical protein GW17_00003212 [Ensete ventricosum]|nr:hypothetical protein GW17_00003212 [Ensete ventricosum]
MIVIIIIIDLFPPRARSEETHVPAAREGLGKWDEPVGAAGTRLQYSDSRETDGYTVWWVCFGCEESAIGIFRLERTRWVSRLVGVFRV